MGVRTMAEISYLDLKKEVWDAGKCSGCGACVAVCPADAISFGEGETIPLSNGYCKQATDRVPCGACYAVCPRTGILSKTPLGNYLAITAGRAAFDIPHKQSGGAVTAILLSALDAGLIDAVITVTEDRFTLRPSSAVITSSDVLIHQAGSRYNWSVPLLAALKSAVIERRYRRIAVVGVPCVVQALSQIRTSDNDLLKPYARAIRLVIGLFCTESFDYTALVQGKLKREYNIEPCDISRLDVRGKLEIQKHDGSTTVVPLADLETCIHPGCRTCTDLTAREADISAGAIGSPSGMTTLIIRTKTGTAFVENAVRHQKMTLNDGADYGAVEKLSTMKIKKNTLKTTSHAPDRQG
jgi:coenzyme F420 hydrogenase subunit beta